MSTYFPKEGEIVRKWFVVVADGLSLGRLASQVARILMGIEIQQYTPFLDTSDHVIVVNSEKIRTTGVKAEQKQYHHYTGYPGGHAYGRFPKNRMTRKPEAVIEAGRVKRMLPKNKLAAHMLSKPKCIPWRQASAPGAEASGFEAGSARVQTAEGCGFVRAATSPELRAKYFEYLERLRARSSQLEAQS